MGSEPAFSMAAPLTCPLSPRAACTRRRPSSTASRPPKSSKGGQMNRSGIYIHRDFMEVVIAEGGEIRSGPRVAMSTEASSSLLVASTAATRWPWRPSGNAWEAARLRRPRWTHRRRNATDTGMREARARDRSPRREGSGPAAFPTGQLETVGVPDAAGARSQTAGGFSAEASSSAPNPRPKRTRSDVVQTEAPVLEARALSPPLRQGGPQVAGRVRQRRRPSASRSTARSTRYPVPRVLPRRD